LRHVERGDLDFVAVARERFGGGIEPGAVAAVDDDVCTRFGQSARDRQAES
jgi:hypothetical protein